MLARSEMLSGGRSRLADVARVVHGIFPGLAHEKRIGRIEHSPYDLELQVEHTVWSSREEESGQSDVRADLRVRLERAKEVRNGRGILEVPLGLVPGGGGEWLKRKRRRREGLGLVGVLDEEDARFQRVHLVSSNQLSGRTDAQSPRLCSIAVAWSGQNLHPVSIP